MWASERKHEPDRGSGSLAEHLLPLSRAGFPPGPRFCPVLQNVDLLVLNSGTSGREWLLLL